MRGPEPAADHTPVAQAAEGSEAPSMVARPATDDQGEFCLAPNRRSRLSRKGRSSLRLRPAWPNRRGACSSTRQRVRADESKLPEALEQAARAAFMTVSFFCRGRLTAEL
jgi:hypothetical protein